MPNQCAANPPLHASPASDWNGWGNGLANTRFQATAAAGLSAATVPNLKLKWAFGFPGRHLGFAQPAIVGGRVYVGTDIGYVYSLDAASGCVYWSYRPDAGVRTAMTIGPITTHGKHRDAVFFGDLKANAYAIDAQTGAAIWRTHVEKNFATRVTAAPALYQGKLFVPISAWEGFQARVLDYPCCTATGSVSALDANTGRIIWKTSTLPSGRGPRTRTRRACSSGRPPASRYGTRRPSIPPPCRVRRDRRCIDLPRPTHDRCHPRPGHEYGKAAMAYQVYAGDSFIVGCTGAGKTDNCPKVLGPDWMCPCRPCSSSWTTVGR